jgi:hypothetical protein
MAVADQHRDPVEVLLPGTIPGSVIALYYLASQQVVEDLSDALGIKWSAGLSWPRIWA